ncbi:IMPACT family protein [Brachybacterium saurashtrense]|uniref:YigZ family protein n=1 Tax=Brachybacterium saurashtrense TaxID=556288 RepID=A0A345YPP8_9MICO|nr:YigZ family protein [Brachybacterium saurashtrense]AXK45900.1 YigZ family protein [Brachybacterium saurashtrense]RRR23638.1 YigZ family protein [Brachybacterium saurashtrense]
MSDPLVLAADVETELVEKRSRFLTRLHRVEEVEQAEALVRAARAEHPDARHHCTAMVLAETPERAVLHRSSDDGEPAGTAGMPMLQSLLHAQLVDTLAIVIRYFGGVKLGAGGLVRAYTAGVEQAVAAASLRRRTALAVARIEVPPAEVGVAENAVRLWAAAHGAEVEPTQYTARSALLTVLVPPALLEDLAADTARWSSGRRGVEDLGRREADVPL